MTPFYVLYIAYNFTSYIFTPCATSADCRESSTVSVRPLAEASRDFGRLVQKTEASAARETAARDPIQAGNIRHVQHRRATWATPVAATLR